MEIIRLWNRSHVAWGHLIWMLKFLTTEGENASTLTASLVKVSPYIPERYAESRNNSVSKVLLCCLPALPHFCDLYHKSWKLQSKNILLKISIAIGPGFLYLLCFLLSTTKISIATSTRTHGSTRFPTTGGGTFQNHYELQAWLYLPLCLISYSPSLKIISLHWRSFTPLCRHLVE